MKAAYYEHYGSPADITLRDIPRPSPRPGEVLVRVAASSVNSWDWDLVVGSFQGRLGLRGFRAPRVKVLGADVCGVVEEVAAGVSSVAAGDAVLGDLSAVGWGGFGEYVAVPERALTLKPTAISDAEAAAIPQAGVLALQSLRGGRVQAGSRVLINGAGGGVGTFAVQLAKVFGAQVTAVDDAGKLDALSGLGADRVIDYAGTDFTTGAEVYDCVIDVVARHPPWAYRRVLDRGGRALIVGGTTKAVLQSLVLGAPSSRFSHASVGLVAHEPNWHLNELVDLVESGRITPVIDSTFDLDHVPDALRYFAQGRFVGKIVVTVS